MIYLNSNYEVPDPETKIWRYMDFTKFVFMLDRGALFFSRIDTLEDPFEGSMTEKDIEARQRLIAEYKEMGVDILKDLGVAENESIYRELRKFIFVNCWHINEEESAAMWKLHLKSDEGIALQTTIGSLISNLNAIEDEIMIGKVKYINYKIDEISKEDMYSPFMHKRKSYEHERELRAILRVPLGIPIQGIWTKYNLMEMKGVHIPLDINDLIDRVYVSPMAEEWFKELVEAILRKYCYNLIVEQSPLAAQGPLY